MTIERFYSFEKVFQAADCLQIAKELGLEPVNGSKDHFNIPWRSGSNSGAMTINKEGWKDHVSGEHGGVIDFVARVKFAGDIQEAQQWLGDYYKLAVDMQPRNDYKTRADYLAEDGYKCVTTYEYRHKDSHLLHVVERWEHPEKKKEFVQRDANGKCSIKDVDTVLYRWPDWHNKPGVCICEGEKDANTIFDLLKTPATTNASGAGTWKDSYTEALAGKNIIIFTDNDDPGRARESFLLWELREVAKTLKVIRFDEEAAGFDPTDYVEKYGKDALMAKIKATKAINKDSIIKPEDNYLAVQEAKRLNRSDFCNFIEYQSENEKKTKPRQANELVEEFFKRFLGFPRKVGETLFDHDRETGEIEELHTADSLFAWMARKSGRIINWKSGADYLSKREFFCLIEQSAIKYEEICEAPVYPVRTDSYMHYPSLPRPDPENVHLNALIDFFNPANAAYKVLLYAFMAAPLYYEYRVPRPCWIIDSEDGAGSGKTVLVDMVAMLYNTKKIETHLFDLNNKIDEIKKRLISFAGRSSRIFLLDNIVGTFHSPQFADMVTASDLSGRPAYGRGEEYRPNNLTYVITANSATIDNDTAQRAFFIYIKTSAYNADWKTKLMQYIEAYRYNIISEIQQTIIQHQKFSLPPQTRFPEFETKILQAFCGNEDVYNQVIKTLNDSKEAANVELEMAECIEDEFKRGLLNAGLPIDGQYFIINEIANKWLLTAIPRDMNIGSHIGYVRNLAKQGFTNHISGKTSRPWKIQKRGLYWNFNKDIELKIIGKLNNDKIGEIVK